MKCNNLLILLSISLLLTIGIIAIVGKSTFGDMQTFTKSMETDNYNTRGCSYDNRFAPQGAIPQSWDGLTKAEKMNLLPSFVKDHPYQM
jgi:hypothetical protein